MRRLQQLLRGATKYPEDVAWLKREIPELRTLTDACVEGLYETWSEEVWCAGHYLMHTGAVKEFAEWLREEVS